MFNLTFFGNVDIYTGCLYIYIIFFYAAAYKTHKKFSPSVVDDKLNKLVFYLLYIPLEIFVFFMVVYYFCYYAYKYINTENFTIVQPAIYMYYITCVCANVVYSIEIIKQNVLNMHIQLLLHHVLYFFITLFVLIIFHNNIENTNFIIMLFITSGLVEGHIGIDFIMHITLYLRSFNNNIRRISFKYYKPLEFLLLYFCCYGVMIFRIVINILIGGVFYKYIKNNKLVMPWMEWFYVCGLVFGLMLLFITQVIGSHIFIKLSRPKNGCLI